MTSENCLVLPECHCAECGAPMSRASTERTSACCGAPRCASVGRRRYSVPEAPSVWDLAWQFTACCDAGAVHALGGRATPRRVALW